MATPPASQTYTQAELDAGIQQALARARLESIETTVLSAEKTTAGALADLKTQLATLTKLIEVQSTQLSAASTELAVRDVQYKAEFKRIEKLVADQWQRLTLICGTVTSIGLIFQVGFSMVNSAKAFLH